MVTLPYMFIYNNMNHYLFFEILTRSAKRSLLLNTVTVDVLGTGQSNGPLRTELINSGQTVRNM